MTKSKSARRASKTVAPVTVDAPAFVPSVAETAILDTVQQAETIVSAPEAPVAVETPVAPKGKGYDKWADVVEKQRANYAASGFKPGSVNAILLPLLEREEGVSLEEAHAAINGGTRRKVATLIGDFSAIMTITQRKKLTKVVDNVKRYFLLPAETSAE
jgi:hypothetical protein